MHLATYLDWSRDRTLRIVNSDLYLYRPLSIFSLQVDHIHQTNPSPLSTSVPSNSLQVGPAYRCDRSVFIVSIAAVSNMSNKTESWASVAEYKTRGTTLVQAHSVLTSTSSTLL
ncbi:hypothetical protein PoB_002969400 [Plakobranchus ocellatus]|uniref:Uncharacterized protein n=1 Tax=Plakobranchus ocellatus TaxID=259542 RepID=A0AAV4A9P8_9GAST|nr:hypothetical protein PoB_002969400 [Plakobranchus ocellatus]